MSKLFYKVTFFIFLWTIIKIKPCYQGKRIKKLHHHRIKKRKQSHKTANHSKQ